MKIDLTVVMLDDNGEYLTEKKAGTEEIPITLALIIKRALLTPQKDDNVNAKVEKYEAFLKTANKTEAELTVEDATLIKKCIGETFAQIIVGQAYRLLEGKDSGIETKGEK